MEKEEEEEEEGEEEEGSPESVDTVHGSGHVLSVVNVCGLGVKDLCNRRQTRLQSMGMHGNNYD